MSNKTHKGNRSYLGSPAVTAKRTHWRNVFLFSWLLVSAQSALAAIPSEWKNTAYAYEAEHKPVREVLEDFAQTFGTQLQIEGLLEGIVNGKIRANTPQSLLDRLGVEHRFQWYLYNNTLYVSTLDQQESARLEVSSETIADLKQALTDIGLLDSRFGWGELPEDGVVLSRVSEKGAIVATGATVFTLSLSDPVWVRAYVAEPDLGHVYPGLKVKVTSDGPFGADYEGTVGYISPVAEFTPKSVETPDLRTDLVYRLRIVVTHPGKDLRQGMPVTVRLPPRLAGSAS